MMADSALEEIDAGHRERAELTRLIAAIRLSPEAEYRAWLECQPEWAAALVHAGKARATRLQTMLANYLTAGVSNVA